MSSDPESPQTSNLKELEALKAFREELTKEGLIQEGDTLGTDKDHVLLRFLRARKFNLKNAKTMLVNCIAWRKSVCDVGIDELYRKIDPYGYPERNAVFEHWPIWYHKTDKKGRPLNIESFGSIDVNALHEVISPERHWETLVVTAESLVREVLPASSYAAGRVVDDVFVIVDLKGFGLKQFWQIKYVVRDCFQISQDYFPETMGKLAVINAPSSFAVIWKFVRPWLAQETQDKVEILGSDYQDVLLSLVDAENLPASLGGKCTCEDKGGCVVSNAGPWMDNRKERREKWLKCERNAIGLSLDRKTPDIQQPTTPAPLEHETEEKHNEQ
ncbi:CRAL/TRIO domain-containing protein [Rickenella mellea]|uniref:CRAL/TRIO domain-containing protein n=1 Tax=Rickenella mellea TaxID=50990 RepID=A0A4Y7Q5V8_9AGAM|nr:CRAL/TRIO domain-containing protein [Rickenella mellea]